MGNKLTFGNEAAGDALDDGHAVFCLKAQPVKSHRMYTLIKRFVDMLISFFTIVAFLPVFFIIAVAIKLDSKGPIIYMQQRIGKDGKPFKMYKFRSMCVDADQKLSELKALNERDGPVFKIANDPRVTRVGKFIRKTCMDELPQLLNILKGEMAIVGPRPPLPNEVEEYTPYQMKRLSITPGLTCYWQVSRRDTVTFEKWVELDLKYIQERSLWVDFKIVLRTVPVALFGKGMN